MKLSRNQVNSKPETGRLRYIWSLSKLKMKLTIFFLSTEFIGNPSRSRNLPISIFTKILLPISFTRVWNFSVTTLLSHRLLYPPDLRLKERKFHNQCSLVMMLSTVLIACMCVNVFTPFNSVLEQDSSSYPSRGNSNNLHKPELKDKPGNHSTTLHLPTLPTQVFVASWKFSVTLQLL